MMPMFDSKMYAEAYSSLHASEDTLVRVAEKAAGARKGKRKALPAFAALLVLTVSVIAFAGGGVSRSAWSFRGSMKDMEKMGFYCPEQLGEYKVDRQSAGRLHVVNAKTGALKAYFKPDYVWMSVTYEKTGGQGLTVNFGPMDDPLWAYVADYDVENDVWEGLSHPETGMREDEEEGKVTYIDCVTEHSYRNCRVYLYDEVAGYTDATVDAATDSQDCRDTCAVWTDQDSGLWFSVRSFRALQEMDGEDDDMGNEGTEGVSQEEMLGYVEEIIIDGCR